MVKLSVAAAARGAAGLSAARGTGCAARGYARAAVTPALSALAAGSAVGRYAGTTAAT